MERATPASGTGPLLLRLFAWGTVAATVAFLGEAYLVHWQRMPTAAALLRGEVGGSGAALLYAAAAAFAIGMALRGRTAPLRDDSDRIAGLVAYIVRGCFFAVLLVGFADTALSWLRIEGLHRVLFDDAVATAIGQPRARAPMVHMPLIAVGFVIALFTRTLGFFWLALLVVIVQLLMVIGRFIFAYEQPFMADLVRLWYSAMFLFASAHTLATDTHVRVDVFYASMSRRTKALVNGIGSVVLGMSLCWTILIFGTATSASTIVGPFLRFEQGQQTFGAMTKYLLAVFLGVFAVTMMFQFAATMLRAAADWVGEPDPDDGTAAAQPTAG